jgi:hypothetical protein
MSSLVSICVPFTYIYVFKMCDLSVSYISIKFYKVIWCTKIRLQIIFFTQWHECQKKNIIFFTQWHEFQVLCIIWTLN